jgi:hypothetical protein
MHSGGERPGTRTVGPEGGRYVRKTGDSTVEWHDPTTGQQGVGTATDFGAPLGPAWANLTAFGQRWGNRENPALDSLRRKIRVGASRRPEEGWQHSQYYQDLLGDVQQHGREMGWKTGADLAARGGRSTGAYGAGGAAQTERGVQLGRMRQRAGSMAEQAQARHHRQYMQDLLSAAGLERGMMTDEFNRDWMQTAASMGLSKEDAQRELEELRMYLGLGGSVLGLGATLAAPYMGA